MKRTWKDSGLDEQIEIGKRYSIFGFFSGMLYPLPRWFPNRPLRFQRMHEAICRFLTAILIILAISASVLIILEGRHVIGVQTECVGSLSCLCYSLYKTWLVYRKRELINNTVTGLKKLATELQDNPVMNKQYMNLHKRHLRLVNQYCTGKMTAVVGSALFLGVVHMIEGLRNDDPNERLTPMLGWFPFDFSNKILFATACIIQTVNYLTLLARDVTVDTMLATILVVMNSQLLFLGNVLGDIVGLGERQSPKDRRKLMLWWVRQHQTILSIFDSFKEVARPLLFVTYAYSSFIFFLALLRLTVDTDFVVEQQAVVIGINVGNLFHLYVLSSLGDHIANNSMRISRKLYRESLWVEGQKQFPASLIIMVRCTKPATVIFADNRVLQVKSFADIVRSMLGYFVTIYQLRH